jgi:hypothetical protein
MAIDHIEPAGCLCVRSFDEGRAMWNEMLTRCPTATLYHQNTWLELLERAYGFRLHVVTLEDLRYVVAACVFARIKTPLLRRRFVALPFSDFCPPLALSEDAELRLMQAMKRRTYPGAALEVRGVGIPAEGWECVERFVNWTLSLEPGLTTIERGLSTNFRRNLRRAARENIVVSRGSGEDYLQRFYRMHLLTRRKLGLPAQPWRFFKLLHEIFAASNDVEVWVASRSGRDIAGTVMLRTGKQIYYKWGARRPGDDSRANHLLIWNALEEYCSNAESIDLGRTDIRNDGLMRFKKELGASASTIPYSYSPRAPQEISAEALSGARKAAATIWRNLPVSAARLLEQAFYRYLA